jgi:choline dehydrogenase
LMYVLRTAARAVLAKREHSLKGLRWFFQSQADPNDWRLVRANAFGMRYPPLSTCNHSRVGSRERLREVTKKHPNLLCIELDALATRILFDEQNRATGVEYLKGERLYRAHANPNSAAGELRQAFAAREIVLCAGAFNTPQLLMLSGIGPRLELERHGIAVRVDLPGVGTNLQDRYEVGVVNRMKADWKLLAGAQFSKGDSQYQQWATRRRGVLHHQWRSTGY